MKTIVLGPPGTGKTTTMLNKVDEHLKETDPNKIGYFAFTKKAAGEAKNRMLENHPELSNKDLKDNFNNSGLTHFIAVSGFNITILVLFFSFILGFGLRFVTNFIPCTYPFHNFNYFSCAL